MKHKHFFKQKHAFPNKQTNTLFLSLLLFYGSGVYADDPVYVDADGDAVTHSLLVPLPLAMYNIVHAYNAVNRAALTGTLGAVQTSMDELD